MAINKSIRVVKGRRPKVVVIGGGTGLPVIVKSLHKKDADVTAIVTVADDGGSSGIIRDYINVVPPGDIRNVLTALSDLPELSLEVFQHRFDSKDTFFAGHAIGNFIIAALSEIYSNIFDAVQVLSEMMQVDGHVYPASNRSLTLNAEFSDGTTLAGESEISAAGKKIEKVWVTDSNDSENIEPKAVKPVIDSILEADVVVLGPGSLFTSVLPNLMIKNLGEAVRDTSAEVIYISNIMTQKGETLGFTDAEHVKVLDQHLGANFVDTVLVNTAKVPDDYMDFKKYDEYSTQVKYDFNELRKLGCRVISDDFLSLHDGGAFHDGDKIANEIMNLAFQSDQRKNEER